MYESRPGIELYYFYDSYGNLTSIRYLEEGAANAQSYYVTTNAQGDVLGIYTAAGVQVAAYEYDAWGNCTVYDVTQDSNGNNVFTEVTYSDSQKFNMEFLNPFRYRGYYYDQDMEMYYLQSRYYDSQIGRFISADDTEVLTNEQESLLRFNLLAYSWNNPVNMYDPDGYSTLALAGGSYFITATAVGTTNSWNPVGWIILGTVAVVITVGAVKIIYDSAKTASKSEADPYARSGQKKQGRERKSKARQKKDWKPRSKPKPPKKHTPGKDHRKYK